MVLMVVGGFAAPLTLLSHSGFCFNEKRFLSDGDKIEAAVGAALLHAGREFRVDSLIGGGGNRLLARLAQPVSADDFLRANPECCRIGAEGPPHLLPVDSGKLRITVVAIDMPGVLLQNGTPESVITASTNVAVDACGKIRGHFNFWRIS
jgi:hypothetical protein